MEKFFEFLNNIRPVLNATGLEQAAGLPRNTLGKHFRFIDGKPHGQALHWSHVGPIVRALCAVYGTITINGWAINCEPGDPAIIAVRGIPGREVQCLETENGFEYLAPQWRQVYDDFDFAHYFSRNL